MQGVKISWVGRSFALAAPPDSCGHKKGGRRKTREERRTMIKSFVEKYKTSNKGDFPSITLTHKEVGGSYYTVREIMRELKQEDKSFDSLGPDLDVMEPERPAVKHSVQPLSIPCELISSSSSQVEESNHSLEAIEEKYQDILPDKEEQEGFIDNGLVESFGHNDQTLAKQEIQVADSPPRTIATPMLAGMEHLEEVKKGQSLEKKDNSESKSFVWHENPNIENTIDLAIVSHIQETGIVGNGSVMESYRSQVETVMEPERPAVKHSVQPLSIPCELISSSSSQVEESNHSLEPIEEKYQDILPDKEEQKGFVDNGLVEPFGHNDQTLAKQEIQVADSPPRTIATPMLAGMEHLEEVKMGQSLEKKDNSESKSFMWHDNPNNENTNDLAIVSHIQETGIVGNGSVMESYRSQVENACKFEASKIQEQEFKELRGSKSSTVIVGNERVMESYIGHVENESKHEASNVREQEFNAINDNRSSAVISSEDVSLTELQSSYDLGPDSFEKQNLPEPLEELEVAFPTVLENASISVTKKMAACDSPLAENPNCSGYSEGYDTHSPLGTSQLVYSTSDSHSTTHLTELPVDLANDEENSLLSNSTNNMLEEPTTLADKTNLSMEKHTTKGETAEIQDGMMECQQLSSPNIGQEQMLTGVQVHTPDAHKKSSSELKSRNLSNLSSSNINGDLTGKTASVPLSIVSQQGQGSSFGNEKQSMQSNSDDEKPISISENIDGTYASTKSFEGPKKQENNIIFAILKTIAEGILYLFKE